jgi:hypothetical protein
MAVENAVRRIVNAQTQAEKTPLILIFTGQPEGSTTSGHHPNRLYQSVIEEMLDYNCYILVAEAVVAMTAFNPWGSRAAIMRVASTLLEGPPDGPSDAYVCGVVLGIFETALWLKNTMGENSHYVDEFDDALLETLPSFISSPKLHVDLDRAGSFLFQEVPFQSRVEKAIESYVAGSGYKYRRRTVWNIIRTLAEQDLRPEILSPLAVTIIDTIVSTQFRDLPLQEKLVAMKYQCEYTRLH